MESERLYIPEDIISSFHKDINKYRKYFIRKASDYLLIDFAIISLILYFAFDKLTTLSRILSIILFLLAIIPKWYIISRRLKEFIIPMDDFWKKYDNIVLDAHNKFKDKTQQNEYIKEEIKEVFIASKLNNVIDTRNHYIPLMRELNYYILFSLFCVVIILIDIGFNSLLKSINQDLVNYLILVVFCIPFIIILNPIRIINKIKRSNIYNKLKKKINI